MSDLIVPEVEVLKSTISFLASRGVLPYQMSPPSGLGIDTTEFKSEMEALFAKYRIQPKFVGNGPDLIGQSETEYWMVECKGSGAGQPPTQRTHFDRALASVVSYYEDVPPDSNSNATVYLGLALPKTPNFLKELNRRVRSPLRQKLNLWVLLYDYDTKSIEPIEPGSEQNFA